MRYVVLGMIFLFALGDGCSPTPNVVGVQDYGQVTGRVLDAMTNQPIPSALVSVGSLYTTTADPKGAFTLIRVPVGDQTVTARAPGYNSATADTTVLKDQAVGIGYVRLVPSVHPAGQPTLPPPPTPSPAPTATPSSAASASPAASGSPSPSPAPVTSPTP
jgi:Carboxypeptidase regulatory-like domain